MAMRGRPLPEGNSGTRPRPWRADGVLGREQVVADLGRPDHGELGSGKFHWRLPREALSPAKAKMRSRTSADTHMPVPLRRRTNGSIASVNPWFFASSRTFKVPQTFRPAACEVRRASMSSKRTTRVGFSSAKAIAASSPGPKSSDNHSDGVARGSTILSQLYALGFGTSWPSLKPCLSSSDTAVGIQMSSNSWGSQSRRRSDRDRPAATCC